MNIEKLQKVNQLATTLRRQGLAAGRDDAAKLAGEMNWEKEDNVGHIFGNSNQEEKIVINGDNKQESQEGTGETSQTQEQKAVFDEEKIVSILQKFADQFSAEINRIDDKQKEQDEILRKLSENIVNMREGISAKENASSGQQQLNTQQTHSGQQSTQQPQQKKQESSDEKPRSGGYGSDDVSIEKFFYYGQK